MANNRKYVWYDNEVIKALIKLGYVHFATKSPERNFKNGRAFFFNTQDKVYGYTDVIPRNKTHECEINKKWLITQLKGENNE